MTERHITLHVKDGADENMTIRSTVFGPVVKRGSLSYALHWCPDSWSSAVLTFWKLRNADDWTAFRNALRDYDYPSQNFIYGDIKNNIGMICAGKMPIKPPGYAGGLLDGTRSPHWQYIPFDSLPQSFNPSRNYLFSANQQPQNGNYYFSSRWYDDLYRPRRIDDLLSQKKKWSLEDLRRMQLDVTDLSVKDLQGMLLKYTDTTSLAANWKSILAWNGELDPGSREACFYKLFRRAASITGRRMAATLDVRTPPSFDQLMNFLSQDSSISYKGKNLSGKEQFHQIMKRTDSLYAVNTTMQGLYAFSIHQLTELPELDIPVNSIGGSDNTINVNYGAHPVIRAITEIGPQGIQSWMINAIGQTGRLNAKGYSQQLPAWISNTLHKTQFTAESGKINAVTTEIIFSTQQ
jgi:penicillin amidase